MQSCRIEYNEYVYNYMFQYGCPLRLYMLCDINLYFIVLNICNTIYIFLQFYILLRHNSISINKYILI